MKRITLKTEPYIIKNKGYSTIEFVFVYPCKYNPNNKIYIPFLCRMLSNTSKAYNTEKKYREALFEKLIVSRSIYSTTYNKNTFIICRLVLLDPKKLKDYNIEDAFSFFVDTIYNPNVGNNEFNKRWFNREKRFKENEIKDLKKEVSHNAYNSFLNIVDDIGVLKNNLYNNIGKLKKLTSKDLYNLYEDNIKNNDPVVFIYGDVSNDIKDLINKYVKPKKDNVSFIKNYSNYLKPFNEIKDIEESSNDSQSILYMCYKVKDMNEEDELYLSIVKNFLGIDPIDLVFKKLRLEKKLIYSCNTWVEKRHGLLTVVSYINNTSKQEVIKNVNELIESLKDKKILKEYIDKIICAMKYDLVRSKDSKNKKLNDFIDKKSKLGISLEELILKYENVDINKLLNLINRLTLDTVYFLRGEFNEEK